MCHYTGSRSLIRDRLDSNRRRLKTGSPLRYRGRIQAALSVELTYSKMSFMVDDLPRRLAERLAAPLPGRAAQSLFEPELSFGRHYAPPPTDARTAAVIALLFRRQGKWYLPLTVRPETMADHAGQVSLPGGMIEPDENAEQAALRELDEELGVQQDGVEIIGRLSPLYLFVSHFSVEPCVGLLHAAADFHPSPTEVAQLLEVPLGHLLDEGNRGGHQRDFHGLGFHAPHIRFQNHVIWGATAMILGELIAVLREIWRPGVARRQPIETSEKS
jgi:8-oxo-dGTP pyrophosphatase MutT (NUDIX family)